nr:MAG TPA: hypothetical protein [Caudoviricetes sp.]
MKDNTTLYTEELFFTSPFQCSLPDQRCPERRNGHK